MDRDVGTGHSDGRPGSSTPLNDSATASPLKPVQPKNAWKTVEGFLSNTYRRHGDERQYRRALYVYWKRGSPYPPLINFDAVKRDSCTVTRATTTTPVQALTLLNDPAYVECARMPGQRMLKDREAVRRARDLKKPEEDAKRLAYGFRLCTSRYPSELESQILRKLLVLRFIVSYSAANGSCCVKCQVDSGGNGCVAPGVASSSPLAASRVSRNSSAESRRRANES